jgi:putative restriction endonuclease
MQDSQPQLWVLKSVAKEDLSYLSIESYEDEFTSKYVYDNFVPNHKQIQIGDNILIIDKRKILGTAQITQITSEPSKKIRRRCPYCGSTNYDERKNLVPKYKCNKGHTFEEYKEEVFPTTKYTAEYGSTFIKYQGLIPISALRPFYINNYNRNMSIQLLDARLIDNFRHTSFHKATQMGLKPGDSDESKNNSIDTNEEESIYRQIKARRGQKKFRNDLRKRYGDKCIITGCKILDILEAAHIRPYKSKKDNHPSNGLLLRADIHTLFDLDLIGINPETLIVYVHVNIQKDGYEFLNGLSLEKHAHCLSPNKEGLNMRWEKFMTLK